MKTKNRIISIIISIALVLGLVGVVNPVDSVAASKIKITVKNCNTGIVSLKKGTSYKLGAKAGKAKITYKSSKKMIVTVSKKGVVKALKNGVSTVTIKAKLGKKTASKKISVKVISKKQYKKVKSLKAKVKKLEISVGDTIKANVKINPQNASNKNLLFSVNKKSVADVTENGQIKAKKAGSVKVKAKSCDNKKATVTITVKIKEAGKKPSPTEDTDSVVEEHNKDSDGDGYPDYVEINYMGTNPDKKTKSDEIPVKGIVTAEGVQEVQLDDASVNSNDLNEYYSEKDDKVSLVLPIEYANVEIGTVIFVNPCKAYQNGESVIVEEIKQISD
ncbi:MAG: Ig-like domain-containing protein, partial [Eubacterium sp.]|nr:Ig-like domain-containing protein [Eubacterium sp.]